MYKLEEAVFDAYPSMREWRRFRFGLIAALAEIIAFLGVLGCTLASSELGYVRGPGFSYAHPAMSNLLTVGMLILGVSVLLSLVGLVFDRQKTPSVVVLASFFPALIIALGVTA